MLQYVAVGFLAYEIYRLATEVETTAIIGGSISAAPGSGAVVPPSVPPLPAEAIPGGGPTPSDVK